MTPLIMISATFLLSTVLLCLILVSIPIDKLPPSTSLPPSNALMCARLVEEGVWEADEYHYASTTNSSSCTQHKVLTASEMKHVFEHFKSILILGCSLSRRLGHNIDQILNLNLTEDASGVFPVSELKPDEWDHGTIHFGRGLATAYTPTFENMTEYLKTLAPLPQPALVLLSNAIHDVYPSKDDLDALNRRPGGLSSAPKVLRNLHTVITDKFKGTGTLVVYRTEPWGALSNTTVTPAMRAASDFGQLSAAVHAEFQDSRDVAFLDHEKIMFPRTLDSTTRLAEGRYHLKPSARYVLLHTLASFLRALL